MTAEHAAGLIILAAALALAVCVVTILIIATQPDRSDGPGREP